MHASDEVEWVAHAVVLPVILATGLIGQTLNLITLHQRNLRSPMYSYLKSAAWAETFSLLFLISFVVRMANASDCYPYSLAFYYAHAELPLINAFVGANTLSIVALTVERYLSICHPLLSRRSDAGPSRTWLVIVALYAVSFAIFTPAAFQKLLEPSGVSLMASSAPIFGTSVAAGGGGGVQLAVFGFNTANLSSRSGTIRRLVDSSPATCWRIVRNRSLHGTEAFKIYLLFREMMIRIGPIVVLLLLNGAIFLALRRQSRKHLNRRVLAIGDAETIGGGDCDKCKEEIYRSGHLTLIDRYRDGSRSKYEHERQRRAYVLLSITVLTFLVCTLPASVLAVLVTQSYVDEHTLSFQAFRAAANLLEFLSYSVNFYIYCLCSSAYRETFLKWWRKWLCSHNPERRPSAQQH